MWISLLDGHPEKAISAAETGVRYLAEHSEFSVLPVGIFGGDRGIRTPDLRDANAALSQLSYIPHDDRTIIAYIG